MGFNSWTCGFAFFAPNQQHQHVLPVLLKAPTSPFASFTSSSSPLSSCAPQLKPIRVSSKTGVPLDVLPDRGLTARQAERMTRINDSDLPRVSTQPRDKQESPEERRARKQAIKEERKVSAAGGPW